MVATTADKTVGTMPQRELAAPPGCQSCGAAAVKKRRRLTSLGSLVLAAERCEEEAHGPFASQRKIALLVVPQAQARTPTRVCERLTKQSTLHATQALMLAMRLEAMVGVVAAVRSRRLGVSVMARAS